ncbi:MAG: inositol monophosphatase family protein [Microcystaceae cyanobacterium]
MSSLATPQLILETLLPSLRIAAAYARQIQSQIQALPSKTEMDNHFGQALTAADLGVQNFIEVALLAHFPQIHFYGEEWEKSRNTQFFKGQNLGKSGDYLITLDPIDGTRFYLDGHDNYQIILSILGHDEYEAVIAVSPAINRYYYALRNQGAYSGNLSASLEQCQSLTVSSDDAPLLLGWGMTDLKSVLSARYQIIDVMTDYGTNKRIPNVNGMFGGELAGAIIRKGNWIDGAALAFMAQETGYIVTTHQGEAPPPLWQCENYYRPGLIVAANDKIHQDILEAVKN